MIALVVNLVMGMGVPSICYVYLILVTMLVAYLSVLKGTRRSPRKKDDIRDFKLRMMTTQ